jgi:hypothetical protein
MMDALENAAITLAHPDEGEQPFTFRRGDYDEVAWDAALTAAGDETAMAEVAEQGEHFERMLFASVPRVVAEIWESPDSVFRASLVKGRSGWWAKVHAPRRGPAFFAMFGLFALIEHASRVEKDRTRTVIPAMFGLRSLCHLYFAFLRGHGFDSMKMLSTFNAVASDVVLADDPEEAFDDVEDSFRPLDVEPTLDVARWEDSQAVASHELHASLADSPLTDETAERLRQEAKRLIAGGEVRDLTNVVEGLGDSDTQVTHGLLDDDATEDDCLTAVDAMTRGYAVGLAETRIAQPDNADALVDAINTQPSNLSALIALTHDFDGDSPELVLTGLFGGSPDAWDQLGYWARQGAAANSRDRFREATQGESINGVYLASAIDYERAFAYGYVLSRVEVARSARGPDASSS